MSGGSPVLPLRPMTIGELLDAAAALLRSRWRVLLGMSFVLAFVEQIFMSTLRIATIEEVRPKYWGDITNSPGLLWVWITLGLTTELIIITMLSGPATRTAMAAIRGEDPNRLPIMTLNSTLWGQVIVYSVVLGVVGGVVSVACFFPWLAVFAIFGLSVPALVADGLSPSKAIWRSPKLLRRSGFRTGYLRLIAYASWLLIRLAITGGAIFLAQSNFIDFSTVLFDYFMVILGLAYLACNTAGYAMLACVDAVTHIEARVRTEGLDIAIARMRDRGRAIVLTAPEAS